MGEFIQQRERLGVPTQGFKTCFICGRHLAMNRIPIVISVSGKKDNTNYKRNKQLGTRVAESVDAARYRAQLIYEATVEEDRDKIWDNRDAWKNLNVLNGTDLVEVVLKSGEKDEILAKLDEISGYQPTMEDVAKN